MEVENLNYLEELLERYILIENLEDIKNLYDKVLEYASLNQITEIKKEVGSYYLVSINNKTYHLGKYLKDNKLNYFLCHSLEIEKSLIKLKEKISKRLIK